MSINNRVTQYGCVFGNWKLHDYIGGGSNGKTAVFRIVRSDTFEEYNALKVVNIIEESGNWDHLSEQYHEDYDARVRNLRKAALEEVRMMYRLQGCANIVNYFDYRTEEFHSESSFGCDLLIRMELLENDLYALQRGGEVFSETEIIKIGKSICSALILCHRENIFHRDIKPGNIFRNRQGIYKLGDFGISRIVEAGSTASTANGTRPYAAPEQYAQNGKASYDSRVDIYSLGLTLYELANENRLPFSSSRYVSTEAIQRRLAGETIPLPCGVSPALGGVILKACAFRPEDRYQTAQELFDSLNALPCQPEQNVPQNNSVPDDLYATLPATFNLRSAVPPEREPVTAARPAPAASVQVSDAAPSKKTSRKKVLLPILLSAAGILLCTLLLFVFFEREKPTEEKAETVSTRPSETFEAVSSETSWDETKEESVVAFRSDACGRDLAWSVDSDVLEITGTGDMYDWYECETPWNSYAETISAVHIGSGVTSIGAYAFRCFQNLVDVTIPDTVTSIGERAFDTCWNLSEISLPNSITSIGEGAFCSTALKSLSIGSKVQNIDENVFLSCHDLSSISVDPNNLWFSSKDGVLFNKDQTLLIWFPGNISGSYSVPNSVHRIGEWAFSYSSLSLVVLGEGLKEIGENAFFNSNLLRRIDIPAGVTNIGKQAFSACYELTDFDVAIGNATYSSVDGVIYSKDKHALLLFPSGRSGFFSIPDGVVSIGPNAFDDCSNLTKITIPDSVTSIGSEAFYCCFGLSDITIPGSVSFIGSNAFYCCDGLLNITISEGVTDIGDEAFSCCSRLETISIPKSILRIGDGAFLYCENLSDVYYSGTEHSWNTIDFGSVGSVDLKGVTIHYGS